MTAGSMWHRAIARGNSIMRTSLTTLVLGSAMLMANVENDAEAQTTVRTIKINYPCAVRHQRDRGEPGSGIWL